MMKCMGAEASARALESQASDLGIGEKVDGRVPSNDLGNHRSDLKNGTPTNSRSHLTHVSEAVALLQAR